MPEDRSGLQEKEAVHTAVDWLAHDILWSNSKWEGRCEMRHLDVNWFFVDGFIYI